MLVLAATLACADKPRNESPFEWNGIRGGMSFRTLDRMSGGSEWKSEGLIPGIVLRSRATRWQSKHPFGARIDAMMDTVEDRALEVGYYDIGIDTAFHRQMEALKLEFDRISGGKRDSSDGWDRGYGPWFITWRTPDSAWEARMGYQDRNISGFQIKEIGGADRVMQRYLNEMRAKQGQPPLRP
jgi:hypothetical protein